MGYTLEDMIRKSTESWGLEGSEYIMRVGQVKKGYIHVYLHPSNRDGITLDYWVDGDKLLPLDMDLDNYIRSKKIKKIIDGTKKDRLDNPRMEQ